MARVGTPRARAPLQCAAVMGVLLLVACLPCALAISPNGQATNIAETMARISQVMKSKLPLCQNQTTAEASVLTQLKAMEEVIVNQEQMLGSIRFMTDKLMETINRYVANAPR
ncbi:uncharacterized protein LOC125040718 [Penaeus chinensis]|uniref:uncharacterized protein LOC125040718 n=1 Tax=Penaeus chinensis TaxID=139456 RepID=UPI001FB690BF|nr:uncharacterized protein LOC125040718 [Penaeus chinensis]